MSKHTPLAIPGRVILLVVVSLSFAGCWGSTPTGSDEVGGADLTGEGPPGDLVDASGDAFVPQGDAGGDGGAIVKQDCEAGLFYAYAGDCRRCGDDSASLLPGPAIDDGNPCTNDFCDEGEGVHYEINSAPCDDQDGCTRFDQCEDGVCLGLDPIPCDEAPRDCSVAPGLCEPATGLCHYEDAPDDSPCDDGDEETTGDHCVAGDCQGSPPNCEPGDWSLVEERCRLCDGDGIDYVDLGELVDDGNPCTTDLCDSGIGILHEGNGEPCDDGDEATIYDWCTEGLCVGKLKICEAGEWALDAGACRLCGDGTAWEGEGLAVDDEDVCTEDLCSAGEGVLHWFNGAPCDDGDAETLGDVCSEGQCAGLPVICEAGLWQDIGFWCILCNELGTAWANEGMALDDEDPCTADICDPATGTRHEPGNEGGWCFDGTVCTFDDHCEAGLCIGTERSCYDGSDCTEDLCDAVTGCAWNPLGGTCDDGNALTLDDICVEGICVGSLDPDGDGVPNFGDGPPCDGPSLVDDCVDNCPADSNASQTDGNDDGVGDACASAAVWEWWMSVDTDEKVIAMTFDDGWNNEAFTSILDTLEAKGASASFFLNGEYVQDELLSFDNLVRARNSGHVIGNHTMHHSIGWTYWSVTDAVVEVEELFLGLGLGSLKPWFRSPGGAVALGMSLALQDTGFTEQVFGNLDTLDWQEPEPPIDAMVQCIVDQVAPGDVFLMHVGPQVTAEALPLIIDALAEMGYGFVTVEQLAGYGPKRTVDPFFGIKSCDTYYP